MENHTHFLKLLDFTPAEIQQFLDTAADLKAKKKAGIPHKYLEGKNVALIFEKTSTRTRCAFEVAAQDLGMGSTYLGPTGSQIGVKESIADTARVLGRMFDGIEYRGFGQELVEELAHYAGVPVFNGLTNEFHPTQILGGNLKGAAGTGGVLLEEQSNVLALQIAVGDACLLLGLQVSGGIQELLDLGGGKIQEL